ALAAVLLATTLTNWWFLRNDRRDDARIDAPRQVAVTVLKTLTNYSPATIESHVQQLHRLAVGVFAHQLSAEFDSSRIAQIKKNHLRGTGSIQQTFVGSIHGNSTTVFAIVTATRAGPSPPRRNLLF